MSSTISHNIKHRKKGNEKDVFITPVNLVKNHIVYTQTITGECMGYNDIWYDPFKNSGNYYNNFPVEEKKDWAEILEGRDFFEYEPEELDEHNLIICSNPPYSMMDKVYERCIELGAIYISLLVAFHSITPRRIEYMEQAGYAIKFLHICKVFKWYGMSCIVIFDKMADAKDEGLLSYDRTIWRLDKDRKKNKKKKGKKIIKLKKYKIKKVPISSDLPLKD